jgi:hypothetical protein
MAGTGIWLPDEQYLQTQGQIWAQGMHQQLQAGENWAQQAIQSSVQQLQAMVPQVPTPQGAPTPPATAPALEPTPTPIPTPAAITPATPAPAPAPAPGTTPTAEPTPAAPAPTPVVQPPPVPTPPAGVQAPDLGQAGQAWANQQIQNLLNPPSTSQSLPGVSQGPQPMPTPQGPPAPAPTPSAPAGPASVPGGPAGPQPATPGDLIDQTRQAAAAAGIDPEIFSRQIQQESGFNPNAQSGAGAQGIAQFMPATAQGLGINPMDPGQALPAAANLMKSYLDKYGGDWASALSAYNAGPGNVPAGGGVPNIAETQNYVKTILGGAQNLVQQGVGTVQNVAQQGLSAVNNAVDAATSQIATRASQFGLGLSSGDAMAFCGPTAAIAFAQTYGRNPTVDEAKQLAQQVGWNPDQGMAGPSSEVKLLNAMGVDAHMTQGVDWSAVGRDASGGNPVIVSTPGHYYYVQGYNADTGQLNVGTSGTDLKGGSEWMTPDQINQMPQSHGAATSAIFADHPLAQQDGLAQSTAAQGPTTMGTNQPADQPNLFGVSPTDLALGLAPFGIGPGVQAGQQLISQLLASPQGQAASSAVQSQAQNTLNAVLNVGGPVTQAGAQNAQDLLQQGANLLQGPATAINQAPPTIQDILTSNALVASGIPTQFANVPIPDLSPQGIIGMGASLAPQVTNAAGQALSNALGLPNDIGGQAQNLGSQLLANPAAQDIARQILAPMLGMPSTPVDLSGVGNALSPQARTQLGQNLEQANLPVVSGLLGGMLQAPSAVDAMQTIQDLNDKYAGTPGATTIPMQGQAPLTLSVDPSVMTPEDAGAYQQAAMVVGQMSAGGTGGVGAAPGGAAADWLGLGPLGAARYAGNLGPVTWGERVRALQQGVISDPATAVKVAMSAMTNPIWSGVTRTAADLLGATPLGRLPFVDIAPSEAMGRAQGRLMGAGTGLIDGGQALGRGLSQVFSPNLNPYSIAARATNPIDRIFGQITQAPGALHGAFMQAGQQVLSDMELRASLGEDAASRGFRPGTQAFSDEVARLVANPPQDLVDQAQQLAARAVGRGQLGGLGTSFANLAGQGPGTAGYGHYSIGNALFPVFRTGWNLLTQGVEKSPLGTLGTVYDVTRGTTPLGRLVGAGPYAGGAFQQPVEQGVAPLAERLTNNVFGTALTAWLAGQAMQGNITGDGPSDPGERAVWIAQGHQPHSVQLPGVGWVNYNGTPFETQLGLAGELADVFHNPLNDREQQQGVLETTAERLLFNTLNMLGSRTGLEQLGQISDLLHLGATNAPAAATQFASGEPAQILGSYVPMSGLLRGVERVTDPYLRQVPQGRTLADVPGELGATLARGIPGLAQTLQPQLDVLGRPMVNPSQGLAAMLPVRQTPGAPSDILAAYERTNTPVGQAPQTIDYGPYGQIYLTPQERQTWLQLRGQVLQNSLAATAADPKFQQSPAKSQELTLKTVDQIATRTADLQLLSQLGPDRRAAAVPRPGSLTAPVQSYAPGASNYDLMSAVLSNQTGLQALQAAQQQRDAERQAVARALLGF